jgi:oligosaccharide repeat unit polymerase
VRASNAGRHTARLRRTPLLPVYVLGAIAACLVGALPLVGEPSREATIATLSGVLVAAIAFAGRGDVTRPHVALPLVWFTAVTVAQLKLLNYETEWTTETTLLVFGGPLVFAAAGAAGSGRAIRPPRLAGVNELRPSRLRTAAIVLLVAGIGGMALKVGRLGGVPLLADQIDQLRSVGGVKIPAYITFLTDCFFLSAWAAMLSFAVTGSLGGRLMDASLALLGLTGVAFSASRNNLLLALLVPVVFLYLTGATRTLTGWRAVGIAGVGICVMTIASGLFYLRTEQHKEAQFESYFYADVVQSTTPALRPLLPVYVGLATPLETLNRVVQAFPDRSLDVGTYSVPGIPPQISPVGPRSDIYVVTGGLSRPYYFNVATYQGAFYADGGAWLVLTASAVLGLSAGLIRRKLLARNSVGALGVLAYLTYVVVFLFYEDLAGFYTLSVAWDVLIIIAVVRFVRAAPEPRRAIVPPAGGVVCSDRRFLEGERQWSSGGLRAG